jgi:hypothetical protein
MRSAGGPVNAAAIGSLVLAVVAKDIPGHRGNALLIRESF